MLWALYLVCYRQAILKTKSKKLPLASFQSLWYLLEVWVQTGLFLNFGTSEPYDFCLPKYKVVQKNCTYNGEPGEVEWKVWSTVRSAKAKLPACTFTFLFYWEITVKRYSNMQLQKVLRSTERTLVGISVVLSLR